MRHGYRVHVTWKPQCSYYMQWCFLFVHCSASVSRCIPGATSIGNLRRICCHYILLRLQSLSSSPTSAILRFYSPFLCLSLTIKIIQFQDGSSHFPSRLNSECNNLGNKKIFNISTLHVGYYERMFSAYRSSMSLLQWIFLNVIALHIFLCKLSWF